MTPELAFTPTGEMVRARRKTTERTNELYLALSFRILIMKVLAQIIIIVVVITVIIISSKLWSVLCGVNTVAQAMW